MTGKNERVIVLKGDNTKWYNQAIFIVDKNTPARKMPVDFVAEAEKIINNYMVKERDGLPSPVVPQLPAPSPYTAQAVQAAKAAHVAVPKTKEKKQGSMFDLTLNLIMILACIAIVAVFVYGMLL